MKHYISIAEELKNVVRLYKTTKREGLIRARIFGANLATGEVNKIIHLNERNKFKSVNKIMNF